MTARSPSSSCSSPTSCRASTTFSSSPPSMRRTASATFDSYAVGGTAPGSKVTRGTRRFGVGWGTSRGGNASPAASVSPSPAEPDAANAIRVTHARPSRRPSTSDGTTRTLVDAESSAKAIAPKATRPVPGSPTRSLTLAISASERQAAAACSMRSARWPRCAGSRRADDVFTATHPEQRMSGIGARDQRRELIDRLGAHDELLVHRTSLRLGAARGEGELRRDHVDPVPEGDVVADFGRGLGRRRVVPGGVRVALAVRRRSCPARSRRRRRMPRTAPGSHSTCPCRPRHRGCAAPASGRRPWSSRPATAGRCPPTARCWCGRTWLPPGRTSPRPRADLYRGQRVSCVESTARDIRSFCEVSSCFYA